MTDHQYKGLQHAVVRPPGASFVNAIAEGGAIRGHRRHPEPGAAPANTARRLPPRVLTVERLPADERLPDSCFMQDPAVVIDGVAVVGRMEAGEPPREEEAVAGLLAARFPTHRLAAQPPWRAATCLSCRTG